MLFKAVGLDMIMETVKFENEKGPGTKPWDIPAVKGWKGNDREAEETEKTLVGREEDDGET